MHQDAHEFLNYLLNSVVEDLTEELKAGPPEDRECSSIVVYCDANVWL